MGPADLDEIEIRGIPIERVARKFVKPFVSKWTDINKFWVSRIVERLFHQTQPEK